MTIDAFNDQERDLPSTVKVKIDANEFNIKREDPYGFWYIHRQHGQLPEQLQGAYTSADYAEAAIQLYVK